MTVLIGSSIRIVSTAALLWVVWHHSHWSVALALTLFATAEELRTLTKILQKQNVKLAAENKAFIDSLKGGAL